MFRKKIEILFLLSIPSEPLHTKDACLILSYHLISFLQASNRSCISFLESIKAVNIWWVPRERYLTTNANRLVLGDAHSYKSLSYSLEWYVNQRLSRKWNRETMHPFNPKWGWLACLEYSHGWTAIFKQHRSYRVNSISDGH